MSEVPKIRSIEPVYPSVDSAESILVHCDLVWDGERRVFVNKDSEEDWILDEHGFQNSKYIVEGTTYERMKEAMKQALDGSVDYSSDCLTVVHEF